MTLNDIYNEYSRGSAGFVKAVQAHCGFDISNTEIERISDRALSADDFQRVFENSDFWADQNNQAWWDCEPRTGAGSLD